ncbi:streptococcal hemagglutinin-like [Branchiostoma lanceolatum]|uniref:streptococcal hemagglutinin-like n=1 Tax=Branchiostoma lanceolatum TaxID=7740 RepID=UPI003451B5C3
MAFLQRKIKTEPEEEAQEETTTESEKDVQLQDRTKPVLDNGTSAASCSSELDITAKCSISTSISRRKVKKEQEEEEDVQDLLEMESVEDNSTTGKDYVLALSFADKNYTEASESQPDPQEQVNVLYHVTLPEDCSREQDNDKGESPDTLESSSDSMYNIDINTSESDSEEEAMSSSTWEEDKNGGTSTGAALLTENHQPLYVHGMESNVTVTEVHDKQARNTELNDLLYMQREIFGEDAARSYQTVLNQAEQKRRDKDGQKGRDNKGRFTSVDGATGKGTGKGTGGWYSSERKSKRKSSQPVKRSTSIANLLSDASNTCTAGRKRRKPDPKSLVERFMEETGLNMEDFVEKLTVACRDDPTFRRKQRVYSCKHCSDYCYTLNEVIRHVAQQHGTLVENFQKEATVSRNLQKYHAPADMVAACMNDRMQSVAVEQNTSHNTAAHPPQKQLMSKQDIETITKSYGTRSRPVRFNCRLCKLRLNTPTFAAMQAHVRNKHYLEWNMVPWFFDGFRTITVGREDTQEATDVSGRQTSPLNAAPTPSTSKTSFAATQNTSQSTATDVSGWQTGHSNAAPSTSKTSFAATQNTSQSTATDVSGWQTGHSNAASSTSTTSFAATQNTSQSAISQAHPVADLETIRVIPQRDSVMITMRDRTMRDRPVKFICCLCQLDLKIISSIGAIKTHLRKRHRVTWNYERCYTVEGGTDETRQFLDVMRKQESPWNVSRQSTVQQLLAQQKTHVSPSESADNSKKSTKLKRLTFHYNCCLCEEDLDVTSAAGMRDHLRERHLATCAFEKYYTIEHSGEMNQQEHVSPSEAPMVVGTALVSDSQQKRTLGFKCHLCLEDLKISKKLEIVWHLHHKHLIKSSVKTCFNTRFVGAADHEQRKEKAEEREEKAGEKSKQSDDCEMLKEVPDRDNTSDNASDNTSDNTNEKTSDNTPPILVDMHYGCNTNRRGKYVCRLCEEIMSAYNDMTLHLQVKHKVKCAFTCTIVQESAVTENQTLSNTMEQIPNNASPQTGTTSDRASTTSSSIPPETSMVAAVTTPQETPQTGTTSDRASTTSSSIPPETSVVSAVTTPQESPQTGTTSNRASTTSSSIPPETSMVAAVATPQESPRPRRKTIHMKFNCNLCKEDLVNTKLATRRSHLLKKHKIRKSDESFFTARIVQDYEDESDAVEKQKVSRKSKQASSSNGPPVSSVPSTPQDSSNGGQETVWKFTCRLCNEKLTRTGHQHHENYNTGHDAMKHHLELKHRITESFEYFYTAESVSSTGVTVTIAKRRRVEQSPTPVASVRATPQQSSHGQQEPVWKFTCSLCKLKDTPNITNHDAMKAHLIEKHRITKSHESYYSARIVQEHEDRSDKLERRNVRVKSKQARITPINILSRPKQKVLTCGLCYEDIDTGSRDDMESHLMTKHGVTGSFDQFYTTETAFRGSATTGKRLREESEQLPSRKMLSSYFPVAGANTTFAAAETGQPTPIDCQQSLPPVDTELTTSVQRGDSMLTVGTDIEPVPQPSLMSRLPSRMTAQLRSSYQVYECSLCGSQYRYFASILEHMQQKHSLAGSCTRFIRRNVLPVGKNARRFAGYPQKGASTVAPFAGYQDDGASTAAGTTATLAGYLQNDAPPGIAAQRIAQFAGSTQIGTNTTSSLARNLQKGAQASMTLTSKANDCPQPQTVTTKLTVKTEPEDDDGYQQNAASTKTCTGTATSFLASILQKSASAKNASTFAGYSQKGLQASSVEDASSSSDCVQSQSVTTKLTIKTEPDNDDEYNNSSSVTFSQTVAPQDDQIQASTSKSAGSTRSKPNQQLFSICPSHRRKQSNPKPSVVKSKESNQDNESTELTSITVKTEPEDYDVTETSNLEFSSLDVTRLAEEGVRFKCGPPCNNVWSSWEELTTYCHSYQPSGTGRDQVTLQMTRDTIQTFFAPSEHGYECSFCYKCLGKDTNLADHLALHTVPSVKVKIVRTSTV